MRRRHKRPPPPHPSLWGQEYVLFPRNPWVQRWDNFFLCVLLYYCFSIPYMVGVSGGYWMWQNTGWFVVNMVLNVIYVTDVFMLFFRAYKDENGVLVYDLRKIAKNYFFSRHFVVNLIAAIPLQLVMFVYDRKNGHPFEDNVVDLLIILQLLKLLRIPRVKGLMESSFAIQRWWEKQDVPRTMLASFLFRVVFGAHFLACFWSFLAFVQAGSLGTPLGEEPNWISNWYYSSYVEGGINPIGWRNDIDRYALSLFWSVQSITSIGYGNIVPVTRLEYYFANLIMIWSGIFWSMVLGNVISIVDHMNANRNEYKQQADQLNKMIDCFTPTRMHAPDGKTDIGVSVAEVVATRARKFVRAQYNGKKLLSSPAGNRTPTLEQIFPVLESLSPELRQLTSLHLMRKYLDMIPFLSHKYLSPEEQSDLAFRCIILEFSSGESFQEHPKYGKGIMILRKGFCMSMRTRLHESNAAAYFEMYGTDDPIAVDDVLVEESFFENDQPLYRFLSYAMMIFIPRSAIDEVLNANQVAWKDCARWHYLQACLSKRAREIKKKSCNGGDSTTLDSYF